MSDPLSSKERVSDERWDRAMRVSGAFGAIYAVAKDMAGSLPHDPELERLRDDIERWANKGLLRAWEIADG